MERYKTTQKAIKSQFNTIIVVGYCEMQDLLRYHHSPCYTTRPEGWSCDIYDMGHGVAITTGYGPFGTVRFDYKVLVKAEKKARKIWSNNWPFNRQKAQVEKLINQLIDSVK